MNIANTNATMKSENTIEATRNNSSTITHGL